MDKKCFLPLLAGSLLLVSCSDHGDEKGEGHVHGSGYAEWVSGPTSDPLSPEDAMKSFEIQDGLVIEQVAAEPLVRDPVAISFDARGRMWVSEMINYMLDVGGTGQREPTGNIVIVEDVDGDGIADKRTVFLSEIVLPRTIAHVEGGILFADNESLYFVENNNDVAGERIVVDPTYAAGGNVEKKGNGLIQGPDNWLYSANSTDRYRLYPLTSEIPDFARELHRTKDWILAHAKTSKRGQWGISSDDNGRLFYNNNSNLIITDTIRPNMIGRNENFYFKGNFQYRLVDGKVYTSRPNPGINRGYVPDMLDDDGHLTRATAASGPVIYRGELLTDFYGHAIIPEPAGNLVTAVRVREEDGRVTGEHFYDKQELLTSTDERFRPVNTYTGPDGGLYIVDMYRGILQDRYYVTQYLSEHILKWKLDKGVHFGRIYRIRDADSKLDTVPDLESLRSADLVATLAHKNSWRRETARRLLVERQDISAVQDLQSLVQTASDDYAVMAALWTLDGLESLSEPLLSALIGHPNNTVKSHAIRLAEKLPAADQKAFVEVLKVSSLDKTESYELAMALAASLGQYHSQSALDMLERVVVNWQSEDVINKLALSGLSGQERAFVDGLENEELQAGLAKLIAQKAPVRDAVITHLAGIELGLYNRGRGRYNGNAGCSGCHGEDGLGVEFGGPPLAGSEWVNGPSDRLVALILHGMTGPVTVAGTHYEPDMEMPALKYNEHNGMADLAGIVAYIRNSWGNKGSVRSIADTQDVKTDTDGRELPYTAEELVEQFGAH